VSLFARVADAEGRLLKVESARHPRQGLVLTFDVGRLWVRPDAGGRQLLVAIMGAGDEVPGGLEDAFEAEPWWRVIGNELARASETDGGAVRLQFRRDEDNPRVVLVGAGGPAGGLDVRLEATAH
jgi:hypothetical protein